MEKATTVSDVDSSVTSGPVFISTSSYVVNSEMENRTSEGLDNDELIRASKNPVLEKDVHEFGAPTDPEKMKDLAAIKVQAAFRGYLVFSLETITVFYLLLTSENFHATIS